MKVKEKQPKLVIGISSRVLFDLDTSHEVFIKQGKDAYRAFQIEREGELLDKGPGFSFIKKIDNLKQNLGEDLAVEIILLSRNSHETGLRTFNSIEEYKLPISRAVFSGGQDPSKYASAFDIDLFLSAEKSSVEAALAQNIASASLVTKAKHTTADSPSLNIAFDADAVIFSDEAQLVYESTDLSTFQKSENVNAAIPLKLGPFGRFLGKLNLLQERYPELFRFLLITARGAPAHKRVINSLRHHKLTIDETIFADGQDKAPMLEGFSADIFFDDSLENVSNAQEKITSALVPRKRD